MQQSNVIELNAVRQWTLLSWLEAVSENSRSQNHEMDLESWLAALDADFEYSEEARTEELPDNVIDLAAYRANRRNRRNKSLEDSSC